jgi:hypothetical protein
VGTFKTAIQRIRTTVGVRTADWSADISLPRVRLPRSIKRRMRRPPVFWFVALAVAITAGLFTMRAVQAAERGAARYGDPVDVVVATQDLAVGDRLDSEVMRVERRPAESVASNAIDSIPHGRTLIAPVFEGQSLVAAQLAAAEDSPLASRIADGHRAVAVGRGEHPITIEPGDRIDAFSFDPQTGEMALATAAAEVIDVTDLSVTLSVPVGDAPSIAAAVAAGQIVLAVI